MSNEFVIVPRAVVDRIADHCKFWKEHPYLEAISDIEVGLRAILAKPAEQHKGEPVAYLCKAEGAQWLQYGGKVGAPWKPGDVQVTPLYTHADPGEVEQFPHGSPANKAVFMALESYTGTTTFEQACLQLAQESRALRTQLTERDALLREVLDFIDDGVGRSDAEWKLIQKLRGALEGER